MFALEHPPEQPAVQAHGGAAAAAAAGMYVLRNIEDFAPAVDVALIQLDALLAAEQLHQVVAHAPQIAGDDQVVVLRDAVQVVQMGFERLHRGRSHGRAHVVRVGLL